MQNTNTNTKEKWMSRIKLSVWVIAAAGIGFIIGLYLLAPIFAQGSANYVPSSLTKMPSALIGVTNPNGSTVTLPVYVASSYDAQEKGLRNVGEEILDTTFLLYDQEEETTYGESYEMQGIRAPLSLAVIDGDGKVLSIKTAEKGEGSVSVDQDHRWVLAVKKGLLDKMGIQKGSTLDTEITYLEQSE